MNDFERQHLKQAQIRLDNLAYGVKALEFDPCDEEDIMRELYEVKKAITKIQTREDER